MKAVLPIALAALVFTACDKIPGIETNTAAAPAAAAAAAATGPSTPLCAESVRKNVTLTSPTAADIFEITAIGKDCKDAVLLTTVRTANGVLLWSHADVAKDTMAFAGIEDTKTTPAQALHELMVQWADLAEAAPASDAPEWKEGALRPEEPSGLLIGSPMTRDEYIAFRTGGGRGLCHPVSMNRTQCVAYTADPTGAGSVTEFFDMRS